MNSNNNNNSIINKRLRNTRRRSSNHEANTGSIGIAASAYPIPSHGSSARNNRANNANNKAHKSHMNNRTTFDTENKEIIKEKIKKYIEIYYKIHIYGKSEEKIMKYVSDIFFNVLFTFDPEKGEIGEGMPEIKKFVEFVKKTLNITNDTFDADNNFVSKLFMLNKSYYNPNPDKKIHLHADLIPKEPKVISAATKAKYTEYVITITDKLWVRIQDNFDEVKSIPEIRKNNIRNNIFELVKKTNVFEAFLDANHMRGEKCKTIAVHLLGTIDIKPVDRNNNTNPGSIRKMCKVMEAVHRQIANANHIPDMRQTLKGLKPR